MRFTELDTVYTFKTLNNAKNLSIKRDATDLEWIIKAITSPLKSHGKNRYLRRNYKHVNELIEEIEDSIKQMCNIDADKTNS